jgi:hypothetical protein
MASTATMPRVLAKAKSSNTWEFSFLPNNILFDQSLVVFAVADYGQFAVLQSTIHELWAWERGSKLKTDLSYTPSTVFWTFPMPKTPAVLAKIGEEYFNERSALLLRVGMSLTDIANAVTDPCNESPEIAKLRSIRDRLDYEVLRSYEWEDIGAHLDLDWRSDSRLAPPKSYIYRWRDTDRRLVLGRLYELNAQRAEEERFSGEAVSGTSKKKSARTPTTQRGDTPSGGLFDT